MIRLQTFFVFHLSLVLLCSHTHGQPRHAKVPFQLYKKVEPERMINTIRDLASTAFEGRELGTDGNDKAVDWISFKMEQTGLAPLFGTSYLQEFPITQYELSEGNYLVTLDDSLKLHRDFSPAYFSANAHLGANLHYAGFGFLPVAEGALKDKIVLMHGLTGKHLRQLKYVAADTLPQTALLYPLFYAQAQWAESMGAAAVIFVPAKDDFEIPFETGNVYSYGRSVKLPAKARKTIEHTPYPYIGCERLNIVVLYATHEAGNRLLGTNEDGFNRIFDNALKGAVSYREPVARNIILGAHLKAVEKRFSVNVGGILHGKFGSPYLLIAANFDQQGQHPTFGYPYLGANANASGVSVLLELATILAKEKEQPEYGIVFLLHNGAERDLTGLRHFFTVNQATVKKVGGAVVLNNYAGGPLNDSVSVFLRMVNRNSRFIQETERAIRDYSYQLQEKSSEDLKDVRSLLPFKDRKIPAFEISSGINTLENRISDVPEKLNYVKMYRLTQFTLELIWRYNFTRNSPLLHEKN